MTQVAQASQTPQRPVQVAPARRGRPRRDDYVKLVIPLLRADVLTLDACTTFSEYPGVRALVKRNQRHFVPLGVSLHQLIERSVADVMAMAQFGHGEKLKRFATFLQLWYAEEKTVAEAARTLQLDRTHVVKHVQRPALMLVAQRFLLLAERADLPDLLG